MEATTDLAGGERVFRSKVVPRVRWSEWTQACELSRDDFDAVVKALLGGWWRSRKMTQQGEKYVLRVRVDPVPGAADVLPVQTATK